MMRDEFLAKIDGFTCCSGAHELALRAVVELHHPRNDAAMTCAGCSSPVLYPCQSIQAIQEVISNGR